MKLAAKAHNYCALRITSETKFLCSESELESDVELLVKSRLKCNTDKEITDKDDDLFR